MHCLARSSSITPTYPSDLPGCLGRGGGSQAPSWALCAAMLPPRGSGRREALACLRGSGRGVPSPLGLGPGSAAGPCGWGRGGGRCQLPGEPPGNGAMRGGASAPPAPAPAGRRPRRRSCCGYRAARGGRRGAPGRGTARARYLWQRPPPPPVRARVALRAPGGGGGTGTGVTGQDRAGRGRARRTEVAVRSPGHCRPTGWVRSVRLPASSHPRFDSLREPLQELGAGAALVSIQVTRPTFHCHRQWLLTLWVTAKDA